MKYIQKQEVEPVEFANWKFQEQETLESYFKLKLGAANYAFDHLPSNPPTYEDPGIHYYSKHQLKDNLLDEQGFICAYCMQGLINDPNCTIDHLEPKSANPKKNTFNYHNLLASCSGSIKKSAPSAGQSKAKHFKEELRHCNNKKDENPIPISPFDPHCESRFVFAKDGHIHPAIEDDMEAIRTIQVLGLNSPVLVRKREAAIERILYPDLPDEDDNTTKRMISRTEGMARIEELKNLNQNRHEPFCIAIIQVIEQFVLRIK